MTEICPGTGRYPCITPGARCKRYGGHSSRVGKVRFSFEEKTVVSSGLIDGLVVQWRLAHLLTLPLCACKVRCIFPSSGIMLSLIQCTSFALRSLALRFKKLVCNYPWLTPPSAEKGTSHLESLWSRSRYSRLDNFCYPLTICRILLAYIMPRYFFLCDV